MIPRQDPNVSWDESIAWLRKTTNLPIYLKGGENTVSLFHPGPWQTMLTNQFDSCMCRGCSACHRLWRGRYNRIEPRRSTARWPSIFPGRAERSGTSSAREDPGPDGWWNPTRF